MCQWHIYRARPVDTDNSVRINQHTCGTLIADLVDALSLLASTSQSKDWKSLPRPVVECIKVLGVCVAKESGFDQQKFCSARSRRSGISTQEGKRRGNRLAPAKRRVADIGGVIPRPVESLPRAPVPAVPLPWAPGRLCPRLNAFGTADSRQNSCVEFDVTVSHSNSITWSRHSRRMEPTSRSANGFCQGDRGAVSTSSIPICRIMAAKSLP